MLLFIYKEKVEKLDLKAIAKDFIAVNSRRKAFFGQF